MIEGTTKRNDWRLGRIDSFISGADGRYRGAVVKTFDGTKSRCIQRPIERLYPIEIRATIPGSTKDQTSSDPPQISSDLDGSSTTASGVRERPTRAAADEGILRRRLAKA